MHPRIPSFPWYLYVACSVTVKEVNHLIIKQNCSLCKTNLCRFIPALQPQCTKPVLHLAFLSFSKHSSNSSLSASVPLCMVRGTTLHGLGTARMLKLCISVCHVGKMQQLSILYCKVGWLLTLKNKKEGGKLSKRQR